MLTFHAIGDWPRGAVWCLPAADSRPVVPEVEALIEGAWGEASVRLGAKLFDGPMCRLESWDATAGALLLYLSSTSYRVFLGTNLTHPDLPDRYPDLGRRILANPVGVSPMLLTADGFLMMGRRNASVAYYPGRVHPFAGAVDSRDADKGGGGGGGEAAGGGEIDVFAAVLRELGEELGLGAEDVSAVHCTGIAEDQSIRQPELIFRVICRRTRAQIEGGLDAAEHQGVWAIPAEREAVERAMGETALLTPVAVGALLLWGRVAFGEEWFASCARQIAGARIA